MAFVTLAGLLAAAPAGAGIVNVQSILATEAKEGLTGSITGSVDWRTGNSERTILGLASVARYRRGRHLFIGIARGEFLRIGSEDDKKTFEHLRYRYVASERIVGEVFAQHELDEQRELELRALAGLGPKIQLFDADDLRLAVGVAYMLEYERVRDDMNVATDDTTLNHRISSYLTGSYERDERLQLVQTVYAQPLANSPGDIRLLSESQLAVKLSERLSLSTTFVLAYDSEPPEGVKSVDTALKTGLTYTF